MLVVIEAAGNDRSACAPGVPGCVATGAPREEARGNMHAAPRMHLDGLREDGAPPLEGRTSAEVVEVA